MTGGLSRAIASGVVTCAAIVCTPAAWAQIAPVPFAPGRVPTPVTQTAVALGGRLDGLVTDERGAPLTGAAITAQGTNLQFAVTDDHGRFVFHGLTPGPYLVRAVLPGYSNSRRELVQVLPATPVWQAFRLSRLSLAETSIADRQVQAAGFPGVSSADSGDATDHDHGGIAWRIRHLRRTVLRDEGPQPIETSPADEVGDVDLDAWLAGQEFDRLARASSVQSVSLGWLPNLPLSGRVQLLTTSSFDSTQQLFSEGTVPTGVAYFALGAPAGSRSNWAAQVAIAQGELSSWALSGSYAVTIADRHSLDVDVAYGWQRYQGGNPFALSAVATGDRNAGALDIADRWVLGPRAAVTLGTRFSRYAYVEGPAMWSPSMEFRWAPVEGNWVRALVSQQMTAPGAEEFVPSPVGGLWLPAQRTFSTLVPGMAFRPERTRHVELGFEREVGTLLLTARAYRQDVDDQIVTLFDVEGLERPRASLGHYFVASGGDVEASGWGLGISRPVGSRFRGSFDYSRTLASWTPSSDLMWAALWAPSARRATDSHPRLHDVLRDGHPRDGDPRLHGVSAEHRVLPFVAAGVGAWPRRPVRRPGQPAPAVPGLHDRRVGSAGRRPEPVPRDRRRHVDLRRVARRAPPEAHRRRRARQVLTSPSAASQSPRASATLANVASGAFRLALCSLRVRCGLSIALDDCHRPIGSVGLVVGPETDKSQISLRNSSGQDDGRGYVLCFRHAVTPGVVCPRRDS